RDETGSTPSGGGLNLPDWLTLDQDQIVPVTLGNPPAPPLPQWQIYGAASGAAVLVLLLLGYAIIQGFNREATKVNSGAAPGTSIKHAKDSPQPKRPPPPAAEPEFLTTQVGQIKLKRIPAGTFLMGSPDNEGQPHEHPQHPVEIKPF